MARLLATVGWRRLDLPGFEVARLWECRNGWRLGGEALLALDGRPSRLGYRIRLAPDWQTRSATISIWMGARTVGHHIAVIEGRSWVVNGAARPDLRGCDDLDLAFSPATNLLPIRRLALGIGARASVRSAWLRFPELDFAVLEQVYERRGMDRFAYSAASPPFHREIRVDEDGFVRDYPGLWTMEART